MCKASRFFQNIFGTKRRMLSVCLAASLPLNAQALGLGDIDVQSFLGEPLTATITVLGDDARDTSPSCFTTVRENFSDPNDLPLLGVQIELMRASGGTSFLALKTRQPVNEPMARVGIQAGCGTSLSREYVILISPRLYEEALASNRNASPKEKPEAAAVSMASADKATVTGLPASVSAGTSPTATPVTGTNPAKKPTSKPTGAITPRSAPPKPPTGDRVVVATPAIGLTVPASGSKQINLTEKKLAEANQQVGTLKSELDRIEETRQKEIQLLQTLEVHIISLQKEMEDLKQQIRHKEELEKKLLAKVNEPKMQLFTRNDEGNPTNQPSEFLWMILVVGGVGAVSAYGTFAALRRQQRNHWG